MTVWVIGASLAVGIAAHGAACAQNAAGAGSSPPRNAIVLVDSTGNGAARPLNDTIMLIAVGSRVASEERLGISKEREAGICPISGRKSF
jgi:hypothetical protein